MSKRAAERAVLTVRVSAETDFLLARQRAKQIAALLGFELQDQTRVATAVSEIARNAFEYGGGGTVEFFVDRVPEGVGRGGAEMRIVVADKGKGIAHLERIWNGDYESPRGMGIGLTGARRLMDGLEVQTGETGTVVTLRMRLPGGLKAVPSVVELAEQLARVNAAPANALADQNQELLRLLHEIRGREAELKALNEELAETNRGVLVLYAELEDKAQAVQAAAEMKTRFLSGVTHELRTPLNSIVSLSRLMLSHSDGPLTGEQEKQAQFILRSAQTMTELVNDLLDLAKLEAGRTEVTLTTFTVAELFGGLRGMFRPLATNPAVKLVIQAPDELLTLHTDEGKVAQILRNFVSNALKFTEAGAVTVTALERDAAKGLVTFSVCDTGVGIAAEDHELVMQEWGQVLGASAAKQKGSGLGLPLSKRLAELLGGTVEFTSGVGHGSNFMVTLPALVREQVEVRVDAAAAENIGAEIVVADDDEVSRYLLKRLLGGLTTAKIVEAEDGLKALEAVRAGHAGVVILDQVMPGLKGLEVARELRRDKASAELAVVLHTSKPLSAEELRVAAENDVVVIAKRGETGGAAAANDEERMEIERVLLGVGLSNMHQGKRS